MTRHVSAGGKVWIRVFPTSPSPRSRPRPAWLGKGNPEHWVAVVRPAGCLRAGRSRPRVGESAMNRAIQKLPFKGRFVVRPGTHGTAEVQV